MWLFTPQGFISVVADRSDPTGPRLLVRARSLHHLEQVLGDYLDAPFRVEASDYAWRAWIRRKDLQSVMEKLVSEEITYPNFKDEVTEPLYHNACMDVWSAMWDYQQRTREKYPLKEPP